MLDFDPHVVIAPEYARKDPDVACRIFFPRGAEEAVNTFLKKFRKRFPETPIWLHYIQEGKQHEIEPVTLMKVTNSHLPYTVASSEEDTSLFPDYEEAEI